MWQNYLNAFLGFCLVVAAFLGLETAAFAWTAGAVGAVILVVGLWGAVTLSSSSEAGVRHA